MLPAAERAFGHLVLALRLLRTHPFANLVAIVGLALGGLATLLVALLVRHELTLDHHWPDAERIVKLHTEITRPGLDPLRQAAVPSVASPLLQAQLPQVEATARLLPRNVRMRAVANGAAGDSAPTVRNPLAFFTDAALQRILPLDFVAGDPATALAAPDALVLLENEARALFGRTDVLGREVEMTMQNGRSYRLRVTGVVRAPQRTHVRLQDALLNIGFVGLAEDDGAHRDWAALHARTYVKLAAGHDAAGFARTLGEFVARQAPAGVQYDGHPLREVLRLAATPLPHMHLHAPARDSLAVPPGDPRQMALLALLAAGLLAVACLNFATLALAQAALRQREGALRRVLGAGPGELAWQALAQAGLSALLALGLALAVLPWLAPSFAQFVSRRLPLEPGEVAVAALGLWLLLAAAGGAWPAWRMARTAPALALADARSAGTGSGGGARALLVLLQFALAIGLIAAVWVAQQQFRHLERIDRGFDGRGVTVIWARFAEVRARNEEFLNAVRAVPGVQAASIAMPSPRYQFFSDNTGVRLGEGAAAVRANLQSASVDRAFFDTYRVALVAGRSFGTEQALDEAHGIATNASVAERGLNVIINEAAVRTLGLASPEAAIGRVVQASFGSGPNAAPSRATVVGVVRSVRWVDPALADPPRLYYVNRDAFFQIALRFAPGARAAATEQVRALWQREFANVPFDPQPLDSWLAQAAERQSRPAQLFAGAALTVVLLAIAGMYALASFTMQREAKEIALRRLLGASVPQVGGLMLWRLARPVLLGALLALPLAWWALSHWLSGFGERVVLTPLPFGLAVISALLLGAAVAGTRVWRGVRRPPVEDLRAA